MNNELLTVKVDRPTWLHGEGMEESYLYRGSDGKMCCFGFVARTLGIHENVILELKTLEEIEDIRVEPYIKNSHTLVEAYAVNDSVTLTQERRESELIELGKKLGIEFVFTK